MGKKHIVRNSVIIIVTLLFASTFIKQMFTISRIKKEISNKQTQLEKIKANNDRLQDEVNKINEGSLDYLEKLARERLGMIKPGEKVAEDASSKK